MAGPVQVVLNADSFRVIRDAAGGGPSEDFFANRDAEFVRHKRELRQQLTRVTDAIRATPRTDVGYVKVTLRRSAWAKSHRPLQSLFKPDRAVLVGGTGLGQMLFEVTPGALEQIAGDVGRAEEQTRLEARKKDGKLEPRPTRARSEVGAIEAIEPFGPTDKRQFTIEAALEWLANPSTGGGYRVELFSAPAVHGQWDLVPPSTRALWQDFLAGIRALGRGISVERVNVTGTTRPTLAIRLERSDQEPSIQLEAVSVRRMASDVVPVDLSRPRHERLLGFLDRHPLVRSVKLPPIIKPSTHAARTIPGSFAMPSPAGGGNHPLVGVIDGGIGDPLQPWIRRRWGFLAESDREVGHGTFIGGLLVAGRSLNGSGVIEEPDGCGLIDIDLFPSDVDPLTFRTYYPNGVSDFLEEVETAVRECRARFGARIFNFSLNTLSAVSLDSYSLEAAKLDQIAEANDAVIVISAGNLADADCRPEWASDTTTALSQLAAARDDGLAVPSESIRNVSVSALNPPGVPNCVPFALANYSRRGPGLRTGVKPDFGQVGGAGSSIAPTQTGLFSITETGAVSAQCGTSYAAPFVAKALARLDSNIEGDVSRETLMGLVVHHASIPDPLGHNVFSGVARHLVGFGRPAAVDEILNGADHQVTLVFSSRLFANQELRFGFAWPASLVLADGKCRGNVSLTLVSTPPLDYRFDAEFVRVNLEASLQQQQEDGHWRGRLKPAFVPISAARGTHEAALIEHGLKWSPTKTYRAALRGVGVSSNWRLVVEYLTRAGETMPADGVPFTLILTIADPNGTRTIFNEVRQALQSVGVQTADIRTAARVVPRV